MSKESRDKKKKEIKDELSNEQDTQVLEQELTEEVDENAEASSIEEELREAKDKYLRLYSEFENFRRRTSKEKLDLITTANKNLMTDLVPVLDDMERAMAASESSEDIVAIREGLALIQNKFFNLLGVKGLKKMGVKKGDEFDDEKHEAITQIPMEGLEGKIVDVVEAGYTLGDSVVRFAKVVVGAK